MCKSFISTLFYLLLFAPVLHAQFMENKGQWPENVQFAYSQNNVTYFIEKDGITLDLIHPHDIPDPHSFASEELKTKKVRQHALKMTWKNSNWKGEITRGEHVPGYTNFLCGPVEKHVGHIRSFHSFTMHEVWPGVSIDFHLTEQGLKYDYILSPSSSLNLPVLSFSGQDSLRLIKDKLHIHTSCGTLIEHIPESYSSIPGETISKQQELEYLLHENQLSFDLKTSLPSGHQLLIDPELIVATYVGAGPNLNQNNAIGLGSDYFPDGSFMATALVSGSGSVYPVTQGVYSNYANILFRAGITRFTSDGSQIIWSTVIGGGETNYPVATQVNNDEIIILFASQQVPGGPAQSLPSTVPPLVGASDMDGWNQQFAYCLVISQDGSQLLRSRALSAIETKITPWLGNGLGSPSQAAGLEVASDGDYIMAFSSNNENVPITENAFDSENTADNPDNAIDAVILRISPDLEELRWCTFYGGIHRDFGLDLVLDDNDRPIVVGTSFGNSGVTTPGAWFTDLSIAYSYNGFIAILSPDGQELEYATNLTFPTDYETRTTNIGNSEVIRFVDLDPDGMIWVYGYAASNSSDILITEGAYNNPTSRGFICKFNPELSELLVSSRVGFDPGLRYAPTAFMVDNCGYIYTSANSAPNNDVTPGWILEADLTEDALQDSGGFYLAVYEPDMTGLHYATLFGGDHSDGGNSNFDKKGIVYQAVCVPPFEIGFNPTPNAWSSEQGLSFELGVFKMDFQSPATTAAMQVSTVENNPCLPHVLALENFSTEGDINWWVNGEPVTPDENNQITIFEAGTVEIELAVFNPETCNTTDTVSTVVLLPEVQTPIADWELSSPDPCNPDGGSINVLFTGSYADSLTWITSAGTFIGDNSIEIPVQEPGEYSLTLLAAETACGTVDSLQFSFLFNPLVVTFDTTASDPCSLPVVFEGEFTGGGQDNLAWSINAEVLGNESSFSTELPQGSHTVTLLVESELCGSLSESFTIEALGTVTAEMPELPESICLGESLSLAAESEIGSITWLTEGGTFEGNNFEFQPQGSGETTVTLIVSDDLACNQADSAQASLSLVEPPIADFELRYLPELCQQEAEVELLFTGANAESLSWDLGDGSLYNSPEVQHTFVDAGLFDITLTAENPPCEAQTSSQEVDIELIDPNNIGSLILPNIFSPNDDGVNDCLFFLPEGSMAENIGDFSLRVFNRWGALIHQSEQVAQRWCPRELEPGTYYYLISYTDLCEGRQHQLERGFSVVR